MTDSVVPYQVVYSERVREQLKALAAEAIRRGDGEPFAAALKEFHRRLRIYPQFGDPLFDLVGEPGQVCNGIIRPLVMRYGIYEERRLVLRLAPSSVAQPWLLRSGRFADSRLCRFIPAFSTAVFLPTSTTFGTKFLPDSLDMLMPDCRIIRHFTQNPALFGTAPSAITIGFSSTSPCPSLP